MRTLTMQTLTVEDADRQTIHGLVVRLLRLCRAWYQRWTEVAAYVIAVISSLLVDFLLNLIIAGMVQMCIADDAARHKKVASLQSLGNNSHRRLNEHFRPLWQPCPQ